jgi:hypothetical protein
VQQPHRHGRSGGLRQQHQHHGVLQRKQLDQHGRRGQHHGQHRRQHRHPAGNNTEIQFNSSGAFGSSSNFTYSGGLVTLTGTISATTGYFGAVSATTYYGDGSHLTGISTQGDRIVSGTGNSVAIVANSSTNIISITNSGVTAGYFNSNGVLTVPGISATSNLTSVTTLFASGRINGSTISASTAIQVGSNALTCGTGISGTMRYSAISSTMGYCNGSAWTSMGPSSTAPVAFSVNRSGTGQTVVASTWTKIQFTNKAFDTNSNFDNSTNYRFTPSVPGYYLVNLSAMCQTDTSYAAAAIYKNGSNYAQMNVLGQLAERIPAGRRRGSST